MIPKFSAFSLIEAAIALIIMGLVSGIALPALKGMLDWQKAAATAQRQEKVLYALASYAIQNKALPYAGNPAILSGKQDKLRRRGIVPYADLGLPESFAKDGYNHWFTYVLDDYYAASPAISPLSSLNAPNRLCGKPDVPRLLIRATGASNGIAVALISHGPQGRGAYPNPLAASPQGADEMQNSASDTEIVDRPLSQDPLHPFSHKVVWVTAKNLLAVYGQAPCPLEAWKAQLGEQNRYEPPSAEGKPGIAPPEIYGRAPYPPPKTPKAPSGGVVYSIPSTGAKPGMTSGTVPGRMPGIGNQ